jgi:hypothetical protein
MCGWLHVGPANVWLVSIDFPRYEYYGNDLKFRLHLTECLHILIHIIYRVQPSRGHPNDISIAGYSDQILR